MVVPCLILDSQMGLVNNKDLWCNWMLSKNEKRLRFRTCGPLHSWAAPSVSQLVPVRAGPKARSVGRPSSDRPTELRPSSAPTRSTPKPPKRPGLRQNFPPAACGGGLKALVVTHAGCTRSINDPRSPRSASARRRRRFFRDYDLSNLKK